jgi:cysteine-rich repeat protein
MECGTNAFFCGDTLIKYSSPFLEECDDGNNFNGDGCSSTCIIEPLYECTPGKTDA